MVFPTPFQVCRSSQFVIAGSSYGFCSDKSPSPASKAFVAGFWEAKESMSGKKSPEPLPVPLSNTGNTNETWQNSPVSDYYRLGWWRRCVQSHLTLRRFDFSRKNFPCTPEAPITYKLPTKMGKSNVNQNCFCDFPTHLLPLFGELVPPRHRVTGPGL
jgi:hypothetical protein